MSTEISDWSKLQQMGEIEHDIGRGFDSKVHRMKDSAGRFDTTMKEYLSLQSQVGAKEAKLILQNYYADTEQVSQDFRREPNPLNQSVVVDGQETPLYYRVEPQGGVMFKGNLDAPLVIGQKFIDGQDMNQSYIGAKAPDQKALSSYQVQQQIRLALGSVTQYINQKFKVRFDIAATNVKPYWNQADNRIELTITDLAADLTDYYYNSPKSTDTK